MCVGLDTCTRFICLLVTILHLRRHLVTADGDDMTIIVFHFLLLTTLNINANMNNKINIKYEPKYGHDYDGECDNE